MSDPRTDYLAEAKRLGVEAAISAASWVADGNSDVEERRQVLRMLEDGDPAVDTCLPDRPTLSGEWADDPTPASLAEDVGLCYYADAGDADPDLIDAICDAWEDGVAETFETACAEELRRFVGLADD